MKLQTKKKLLRVKAAALPGSPHQMDAGKCGVCRREGSELEASHSCPGYPTAAEHAVEWKKQQHPKPKTRRSK